MNDTARINWLERQHTLHGSVEMLYVVDGYEVQVQHDHNHDVVYKGDTLRKAIDAAMAGRP